LRTQSRISAAPPASTPQGLRMGDGIIGPFRAGEIANPDSSCMQAEDDAGVPCGAYCGRLGRSGASLQRCRSDQEPGCRSPVRRLAWWIDRPSASALGISPRTGLGVEARAPRLWAEQGARARRSRASDTPRGMVERPIQAPGGRRRRPSRAFFVPFAIRSEANGREPGRPAPPFAGDYPKAWVKGAACNVYTPPAAAE
jgi:hypothetical protein